MFGRFFLLILSVISLVWIVYIGYDLLDKKDKISPQNIFTVQDGEILIVNRTNEVQTDKLDFDYKQNIQSIFEKIMKNVFPNERIYVSQKRPIIIIELPRIWTEGLVSRYLQTKQIVGLGKNGYFFKYKKNYLMIYSGKDIVAHEEDEWPLWDSKASASVIHLEKPLKSTNIYFKDDGTVYYQTKYGPLLACKKLGDNDYFAQFLPSELNEYHFYEKEFAVKNKVISSKSPLYQWMEDGMVLFEYKNTPCILSDFNKSIDPMQMLLSDTDQLEDMMSNHFKNIALTKKFPSNLNAGFYLGKLGDKVLVCEKKEVLEKIIADYQLGNTLALNPEKLNSIFFKMPKKVSERLALSNDFYALSSYKNLLIKTEIYDAFKSKDTSQLLVKKDLNTNQIDNSSFSTSQETSYFLGNDNLVFSIGKQNEIIALSNKKQVWKIHLDGEILGQLKLVENDNGKQHLLVSTRNKIYLIHAQDGSNVNEFPLSIPIQNPVNYYRWNGKINYLAISNANELVQIADNGRIVKRLKLKLNSVSDEVDVYKNGKILTAIITGQNKVLTVDLDKNKVIKSSFTLPSNHLQLKTDNGYNYFAVETNGLVKYNLQGQKSTILTAMGIQNFKKIYRGKEQLIAFQSKQTLYVINNEGAVLFKTTVKLTDIEDFDFITTRSGKTYMAVLEGIQNDIFIFDQNGNQVVTKTFEGKNTVKLSENQGKLNLTSNIDRNIIQHYDVLNE